MLRLLLVASSKDYAPRTEAYAFELGDTLSLQQNGREGRHREVLRHTAGRQILLPVEICPGTLCVCTWTSHCMPVPSSTSKIIFPFPRLRSSSSALCVRKTSTITAIVKSSMNTRTDHRSLRPSTHHCPLVAPKPAHPHQFSTQNPPHRHRGQSPTHGEFTHANDHGCSGGFEIGSHLHVRDGKKHTTTITASTMTAAMTATARGSKRLR